MQKIRFGTDGWRGIIADNYTFENVRIIAQATAEYVKEKGTSARGIAVGYDYRSMSETYAMLVAEILAANGVQVLLGQEAVPTPALSYIVKKNNCAGGVMITASHNPPHWNGVKFKGEYGGSAIPAITKDIEKHLYKTDPKKVDEVTRKNIVMTDLVTPYLEQLKSLVDLKKISDSKLTVVHDGMHGSGKNYLEKLLEGTDCQVISIRSNRDCLFGGVLPEPIPKNTQILIDTIKKEKADLGVATDGDADRLGITDSNGVFVWPHYSFPLLYEHLTQNRGWTGEVVHTVSLAPIIDKLIEQNGGGKVTEVPVGFKNVCEIMLERDVLIGGEESGGIGFKNHIPERDGLLIALLTLEMLATTGKPLSELVKDLENRFGAFCYDRIDAHLEDSKRLGLIQRLRDNPPTEFAGIPVEKVCLLDGIKFSFHGNGWLLIRASDTEPVVRLYAGSETMDNTWKILNAGKALCGITDI